MNHKDLIKENKLLKKSSKTWERKFHSVTKQNNSLRHELYQTHQAALANEWMVKYAKEIFNLLPGNMYWKDRNCAHLGCNNNLAKICKLKSPKDIIGKTNHDLYQKNIADKITAIDQKVMKSNKALVIEEIGIDANGNLATYLTCKTPLRNTQGKVIGLLGTSLNITDRKKTGARK